MSNNPNLMDTEPGGEQTQYEGEYTDILPPKKLAGQFGGNPQVDTATDKSSRHPNTVGITPSEKVRFGHSIRDSGMGGQTTATGEASTEGGFGGTKALHESAEATEKARREQGYGGEKDMDPNIGA